MSVGPSAPGLPGSDPFIVIEGSSVSEKVAQQIEAYLESTVEGAFHKVALTLPAAPMPMTWTTLPAPAQRFHSRFRTRRAR